MTVRPGQFRAIYIAGDRVGLLKIGMSYDPYKRAITLTKADLRRGAIRILAQRELPKGNSLQVEKRTHALLVDFALGGEWFLVGLARAIEAMETAAAEVEAALPAETWREPLFMRPSPKPSGPTPLTIALRPRGSKQRLAAACGVRRATVSAWIGHGFILTGHATTASKHLGVPVGDLLPPIGWRETR